MSNKREQISVKLSKPTKSELDKLKKFKKQTYDEVVRNLVTENKNCYNVELNNVDVDWKERNETVEYFSCPKCKATSMSLFLHKVYGIIDEYLHYKDDPYNIKSLLKNISIDGKSIKNPEAFLKELEEVNKDLLSEGFSSGPSSKHMDYLSLVDADVVHCHDCKETTLRESWKLVGKSARVLTCPKCNYVIVDDSENKTFKFGILMCAGCDYYFDRNWEIFNHIGMEQPTVDHLRYDSKDKVLTIYPYSCNVDYLIKFLIAAKKLGYFVAIMGQSDYHPNTLRISFRRATDSIITIK